MRLMEEKRSSDSWLYQQLYYAYIEARRGKRGTTDEYLFEMNLYENLTGLAESIQNRLYKPSRGIAFVTHKPVDREIFAAPFRDRVVHHFLYDMCADWWDRRLIYDSYSCRLNKGTSFGIQRLQKHILQVSEGYKKEAWVIKLDLQGYFMSLKRDRLFERVEWGLERQFADNPAMYDLMAYIWGEVIFDDPIKGAKIRGDPDEWNDLPDNKSLFHQPPGQGIVIGNLSSQLLSNIYLDQLDRYVRFELGYKHYGRYVDDFFLVVTKDELPKALEAVKEIERFLCGLELTLHPDKRYIQEVHKGVEFLGAVIYPFHVVPGRRFVRNFTEAAAEVGMGLRDVDSVISYLGHMKYLDSKMLAKRVFERMGWVYRY